MKVLLLECFVPYSMTVCMHVTMCHAYIIITSKDESSDVYHQLFLYHTSKCTCPIVQEQMISYYNDIDLYMLNMVNSGLILRKQQQQH